MIKAKEEGLNKDSILITNFNMYNIKGLIHDFLIT